MKLIDEHELERELTKARVYELILKMYTFVCLFLGSYIIGRWLLFALEVTYKFSVWLWGNHGY